MFSRLVRSVQWLAGLEPSEDDDNRTGPSRDDVFDSVMDAATEGSVNVPLDDYEPTFLDVLVVKVMLVQGLHLPPELVDTIIDQAGYWPHTTTEVVYGDNPHTMKAVTRNISENEFLLRTPPLGFPRWSRTSPSEANVHQTRLAPKPVGQPYPPDAFQEAIGSPIPTLARPCRKIVFTIRSRDQGWGGEWETAGTYRSSWTWFEAGLERWCINSISCDAPQPQNPSLALEDLSTLYPAVKTNLATGGHIQHEFQHELHPVEHLKIQCNQTAGGATIEHRVVWSCADDVDPIENSAAAQELAACGRGTGTGDGKFVRELQLGDVVTVWAKARFLNWVNYIESVKVDVYWVV